MNIAFSSNGWDDYLFWQTTDRKIFARLNNLIKECGRTPFAGTGKPEPLRGAFSGWWSRRLTDEHRLVCRVTDDEFMIAECRQHY